MKRTDQSAPRTPPAKPLRVQNAGLYGEIAVLPVNRAAPAPVAEPRTFA